MMDKKRVIIFGILLAIMVLPQVRSQEIHVVTTGVKVMVLPADQYTGNSITNPTIYGWFDMNENQVLDFDYEIETFLEMDDDFRCNSTNWYPSSSKFSYFAIAPGYYPKEGSFNLPSIGYYDYTSHTEFYFPATLVKKAMNVSVDITFNRELEIGASSEIEMKITVNSINSALGSNVNVTDWITGQKYGNPAICITIPYEDANDVMFSDYDYFNLHYSETQDEKRLHFFYSLDTITNHNLIFDTERNTRSIDLQANVTNDFEMYVSVIDMLLMDSTRSMPVGEHNIIDNPFLVFNGTDTMINETAICLDYTSDFPRNEYPGGKDYGFTEYNPNPVTDTDDQYPIIPVPGNMAGDLYGDDPIFWAFTFTIGIEFIIGYIIVKYRKRN